MASKSLEFQVLTTATRIKLRELNAHEHKLRAHYERLVQTAAEEKDAPATLRALYGGMRDLQVVQTALHPGLQDVGALADLAACDPWTTRQSVAQRTAQLEREIRERRSLWRHNKLLGALLHESLAQETTRNEGGGEEEWTECGVGEGEGGVATMTKEQTQQQLETYFFQPAQGVDEDEVYQFLETEVFHRRDEYSQKQWERVRDTLSRVRQAFKTMSEDFTRRTKVDAQDVKQAVELLLRDEASLNPDVVSFLKDAKRSDVTLQELAHVLTIELTNLNEFQWPSEGVPVQLRRAMNGRFRCHLQEDAVTLLLFQFVGMKWGETLREQLSMLLKALDDNGAPSHCVEATRRELRDVFTLAALDNSNPGYDDDGTDEEPKDKLAAASKQDLLRLLSAEARYQSVFSTDETVGQRSITAVTTDLEFFGPSVAHATALACLRFFGVDTPTLEIFKRYMQIPLVFPGFDAPKQMLRGVSTGRAMSMFLAEAVLFIMDFSVRSMTRGTVHLFRRFDDFIFYDSNEKNVALAWETMQQWTKLSGLQFNAEKSGSVRLQWSSSAVSQPTFGPAPLPQQPIHWGLLELQSDATVRILQDKVDAFASDMADRLKAARSVFGWINVYNKYTRFFLRNFGSASPVFGLSHLDSMLETLQRVHHVVFASTDGDVLAALRLRIARSLSQESEDLAADELPAAWAQWPLELGGLGLFNPFLALWSLRFGMRNFQKSHHTRVSEPWPKELADWPWREPFTTQRMQLESEYKKMEERVASEGFSAVLSSLTRGEQFFYATSSEISDASRKFGEKPIKEADIESFRMRSLQEFLDMMAFMPNPQLQNEFRVCLMQVDETKPEADAITSRARDGAAEQLQEVGLGDTPYWQWLAKVFSEQIMDEFGTVSFFSRELLPAQLIETIKKTAVTW